MSNFKIYFVLSWGRQAFKLKINVPSGLKEQYLIQKGWIFLFVFFCVLKRVVFEGGGGLVKC